MSIAIERRICKRLVDVLLDEGYGVGVNDGEETTVKNSLDAKEIMSAIQTTDEDYILVYKAGKRIGWVRMIWSNGTEVLTDYTTNLEDVLKPVNDYINLLDN